MVRGQRLAATATVSKNKKVAAKGNVTAASTPKPSSSNKSQSVPNCAGCGIIVTNEVRALQCDGCGTNEAWKCADCLSLTNDMYDQLLMGSELKWLCGKCKNKITSADDHHQVNNATKLDQIASVLDVLTSKVDSIEEKTADKAEIEHILSSLNDKVNGIDRIEQKLSKLNDKVNEFERIEQQLKANFQKIEQQLVDKINTLEHSLEKRAGSDTMQWQLIDDRLKKLESKPSVIDETQAVQGALHGVLQQDKAEEMEIEQRKKNVIVHGVPESQVASPDQRVDEDVTVLAAMFHEVGVDDVQVKSVVRLGKRSEDPTQNPRPMKVVLDTVEGKTMLLRNAKNLRQSQEGGWTKVFIHQDLTPRQREARKPLVAELKQRKANGEKDLIIFNGKIVQRKGPQSIRMN